MSGNSDGMNLSNSVSLAPKKGNVTQAVLPSIKEQTQNQGNSNQYIATFITSWISVNTYVHC